MSDHAQNRVVFAAYPQVCSRGSKDGVVKIPRSFVLFTFVSLVPWMRWSQLNILCILPNDTTKDLETLTSIKLFLHQPISVFRASWGAQWCWATDIFLYIFKPSANKRKLQFNDWPICFIIKIRRKGPGKDMWGHPK